MTNKIKLILGVIVFVGLLIWIGSIVFNSKVIPSSINLPIALRKTQTAQAKDIKVVYIQPLGQVDEKYINAVVQSVTSFFKMQCIVKPKVDFTTDILAASNTRYEASKILNKYHSKENLLIITEKDIACKNGSYAEWGIFGLGERPGTTCVVSTYRLRKNVSESKVLERLEKVALHEIGHNLGLDHCTNNIRCLMNNADGTIKQVDREEVWFCEKCLAQL